MVLGLTVVTGIGAVVVGFVLLRPILRQRHRRLLRARAWPVRCEQVLTRYWPLYRRLTPDLRGQLQGHVQVLLDEKDFVGCAGLQVTETMRLVIAAQAALLLLNRPTDYYPQLRSILIYPAAFRIRQEQRDEAGVHSRREAILTGESWDLGKVVVSWDDVEYGAADSSDGANVVLHEFAHQLDQESGRANGAPLLETSAAYGHWSQVLSREFAVLRQRVADGQGSVMDGYGATNPAEFFAVATETFFEKSHQFRDEHPELYAELRQFYHVDPCEWKSE
jgi:Mlc titration factor MtfA (ptsG expression regulator)